MKSNNELFTEYLRSVIETCSRMSRKVNADENSLEVTSSWLGDMKRLEDQIDDLSAEMFCE